MLLRVHHIMAPALALGGMKPSGSMHGAKSWKLDVIEVGGHPDKPYQIGRSTLVTSGPNGDRTSIVEFLAIWRREANGKLRMVVDYCRY